MQQDRVLLFRQSNGNNTRLSITERASSGLDGTFMSPSVRASCCWTKVEKVTLHEWLECKAQPRTRYMYKSVDRQKSKNRQTAGKKAKAAFAEEDAKKQLKVPAGTETYSGAARRRIKEKIS